MSAISKKEGWVWQKKESVKGWSKAGWKKKYMVVDEGRVVLGSSEKDKKAKTYYSRDCRVFCFSQCVVDTHCFEPGSSLLGLTTTTDSSQPTPPMILQTDKDEKENWLQVLTANGSKLKDGLAESISANPDLLLDGWLSKNSDNGNKWEKRFFVLLKTHLDWYKSEPTSLVEKPMGYAPLSKLSVVQSANMVRKINSLVSFFRSRGRETYIHTHTGKRERIHIQRRRIQRRAQDML